MRPSRILHAVFAVPAGKGYTVSDITINGQPIHWAGQIAQTFQMQLSATGFPGITCRRRQRRLARTTAPDPTPQAIILIDNGLLDAYNALYTIDGNVTNSPVLPAPVVQQGQTVHLALQCSDVAVESDHFVWRWHHRHHQFGGRVGRRRSRVPAVPADSRCERSNSRLPWTPQRRPGSARDRNESWTDLR